MADFLPEGRLTDNAVNQRYLSGPAAFSEAVASGVILEARASLCDYEHNLVVDLGFARGLIPRCEGAIGIEDGSTRDIALIARVNKPVCFVPLAFDWPARPGGHPTALLSRRTAQERCRRQRLSALVPGDIIDARVTHLENFGCFVDIGCGIPSLIPIDRISVSRISHPADRFWVGQDIRAVVREIEGGRISLTHRELLGSWEENAAQFRAGETVSGVVRSVEDYGIFVELAPNLAGLAEPFPGAEPGMQASVYIKSILPERMKIKLIIVDAFGGSVVRPPLQYFQNGDHIDRWVYSTEVSRKQIESVF